jgi:cation diffusion facilitator family transporter
VETRAQTAGDQATLRWAMRLSLAAGLLMLLLKGTAAYITGSTAILSDAAESVVHLVAVGFAAYSLRLSHKPADEDHLYGHAKIGFFSAGFEGAMIVAAALYIIYTAVHRWLGGLDLQHLGLGTALTALAALLNGGLGWHLVRTGRRRQSLILEANGQHVLTDCWTSLGVLVGLALALTTGWSAWDPIAALLAAANILVSGIRLMRESFKGLMDTADPRTHTQLLEILDREAARHAIAHHHLRHRNVGDAHWVEVHLLFPRDMRIQDAHRIATEIENLIEDSLQPRAHVTTHLECIEDHSEAHAHHPH